MSRMLGKVIGVLAASYAINIFISVVIVVVTLGGTEHWGAARTGNALLIMLGAIAFLFVLSDVAVFLIQRHMNVSLRWSLISSGAYFLVLAVTLVLITLFCAVMFNR